MDQTTMASRIRDEMTHLGMAAASTWHVKHTSSFMAEVEALVVSVKSVKESSRKESFVKKKTAFPESENTSMPV